jgi:hypothetical protein
LSEPGSTPSAMAMSMDFLRLQYFASFDFPGVEDFAA